MKLPASLTIIMLLTSSAHAQNDALEQLMKRQYHDPKTGLSFVAPNIGVEFLPRNSKRHIALFVARRDETGLESTDISAALNVYVRPFRTLEQAESSYRRLSNSGTQRLISMRHVQFGRNTALAFQYVDNGVEYHSLELASGQWNYVVNVSWRRDTRQELRDEFVRIQRSFREKSDLDVGPKSYFDGRFYFIDTPDASLLKHTEILGIGFESDRLHNFTVRLWRTAGFRPVKAGLEKDLAVAKGLDGWKVTEASIQRVGSGWRSQLVGMLPDGRRIFEDKALRAGGEFSVGVVARSLGERETRGEILKALASIEIRESD